MRRRRFLAAVSAVSMTWACGRTTVVVPTPPASPVPQRTRFSARASEYAYEFQPDQLEAGLTDIAFENTGKLPHELIFGRLKDGATLDEYRTRVTSTAGRAATLLDAIGGPSRADPGERHEAIFELVAGTYVAYSGVVADGGPEVVSKQMWKTLSVLPSSRSGVPEPQAEINARAKEGAQIELAGSVRAGRQIWKMTNTGQGAHSLEVFHLESGKMLADFLKWVRDRQGARPFSRAGGVIALAPGTRAWAILDLRAGDHVAFDGIGTVAGLPAADPLAFGVE